MNARTTTNRIGGLAALFCAISYVFGFSLFFFVLDRTGYNGLSGDLAFALDNKAAIASAMIVLYLSFGVALVMLVLALHRYMASKDDFTAQIAAGFGLIWAGLVLASGMTGLVGLQTVATIQANDAEAAAIIWSAVSIVQSALGGGIEMVGGVWMMLVCIMGLQKRLLPNWLSWPGIAVALTGIITLIPGFGDLAALFGIGQIIWFAALGAYMLSWPSAASAHAY